MKNGQPPPGGPVADDQPVGFDTVVAEEFAALPSTAIRGEPAAAAREDAVVGLAFSGGGIRSATFGLGVLEALQTHDLLRGVHYLSTVSGGGYIGSWFTASCHRAAQAGKPDWRAPGTAWAESIAHLRRYSNYLSPDVGLSSADTWSMFTVWARNALLVQLTVAFCVACLLLLPRLAAWLFVVWPEWHHPRWVTIALFILSAVGIAGNLQTVSRTTPPWWLQVRWWWIGVIVACACGSAAWFLADAVDFRPFIVRAPSASYQPARWLEALDALVIAALLVVGGYFLLPAGVGLYGRARGLQPLPTQVNYAQKHVQWLIVAPLMVSAFFVGAILWDVRFHELKAVAGYGDLLWQAARLWPFPLSIVFVSLAGLSFCTVASFEPKRMLVATVAAVVSMGVMHLLLAAIVLLLRMWEREHIAHAFVATPTLVLYAFSLVITVLIGMVGRHSTEGIREWWSRLGAWLVIYGAAWVIVAVSAVYGPWVVDYAMREHTWLSWSSIGGWAGTIAAGLFAGHSDKTGADEGKGGNPLVRAAAIAAPFLFIAGLLIGVAAALDAVLGAFAGQDFWAALSREFDSHCQNSVTMVAVGMLGVCGVVAGLFGWRIDINEFSLNAFYRNRLVRAFLGATRASRQPHSFTGFDDADDLPLSTLANGGKPAGPLHLVNCALNLGGSGDLSLHTRKSASFTLSPLHVGSHYCHADAADGPKAVRYVRTKHYGKHPEATTLGKAIAVSGAAASPNMGYHTSPLVAFLLTMFNLRLGWWFANPDRAAWRSAPHFNLRYMFRELFGGATYKSNFLMVSDGGHFENLAVYELVKRRCAVIIASDAECDPTLAFAGLGTLIRMCDVDGIGRISIDVGSLKLRDGGRWSDQRCAVGRIAYPPDPARPGAATTGILVYFKAALTGLEPTPVLQYKASHPTFPHETTGDQFYSEDQFESYRRLGFDVVSRALTPALARQPKTMQDLAETLRETSSPTLPQIGSFTTHSDALIGLWDKLRADARLEALDTALLAPGTAVLPVDRVQFYTAAEMIQRMENAYLDLRLEETWHHPDHLGWQALFKRWASLPEVVTAWQQTGHLFGVRFGYFCERELGLPPVPPRI
jgi:hypothetical protein